MVVRSSYQKKYQRLNAKKLKAQHQQYYVNHVEEIKQRHHQYYLENKERIKRQARQWAEANPERKKRTNNAWAKNNKEARRGHSYRKYGITTVDYDMLLKKQKGRCAICRTKDPVKGNFFSVDHSHRTKRLRGLLCINCNAGLGQFKDSVRFLRAAILYLGGR